MGRFRSRARARRCGTIVAGATAVAFPMLIDVYLLQQFFYYFFVLLAAFVLIFDAFTLFDLLADISRNHIGLLTVLNYFRYLAPETDLPACAAGDPGGDARDARVAGEKQ